MRITALERLKTSLLPSANGLFGTQGKRLAWLGALIALTLLLFHGVLRELYGLSVANEQYSHILLIPFITAYLLFRKRGTTWQRPTTYSLIVSLTFFLVSGVLSWTAHYFSKPEARLQMSVLAFIAFLVGTSCCFGRKSAGVSRFPLLFLLLMVPLPSLVLDKVISLLQVGSAEISQLLFELTGVPVLRDGLLFSLPGLNIEITKECSGIRSSIALMICAVLMAHLQLQRTWTKTVLLLAVVPVVLMKNALRIVTLSLLAVYVDRDFLTGRLHNEGGILFFLLALLFMMLLLKLLRTLEARQGRALQPAHSKSLTADPKLVTELEKA